MTPVKLQALQLHPLLRRLKWAVLVALVQAVALVLVARAHILLRPALHGRLPLPSALRLQSSRRETGCLPCESAQKPFCARQRSCCATTMTAHKLLPVCGYCRC